MAEARQIKICPLIFFELETETRICSTYEEAVNIMGFYGEDVSTVNYVNWLTMARAGIVGLKNYSPDTKEWTQAHARARYVILQVTI